MVPRFIFLLIAYAIVVKGEVFERSRERQRAHLRLDHSCDFGSCFPSSGDLLIGREDRLYASSTCGTNAPERYCDITDSKRTNCFWCDSRNGTIGDFQLNHRIQNVIYKYSGMFGESWWQSKNGKEDVSIQLDLEVGFHIKQLMLQFKKLSPNAMLVESSSDFKKTWRVYRYFAYNCSEAFPGIPEKTNFLSESVCDSLYFGNSPSIGETLNFKLLSLGNNSYSEESQFVLSATNLRINFTKLHIIPSHVDVLDNRAAIRDTYYYAIKKMRVLGSCFCNGHAARCVPISGVYSNDNIVHGRCKCAHNTVGLNCEQCDDLFNDLPWRPAVGKKSNECEKCECNNHATKCHFDPEVYNRSGKLRGGVCDDCRHNTMGIHCERCQPIFFRDQDLQIQDPYTCDPKPCDCDLFGVLNQNILCYAETDLLKNFTAGQCICKANVGGFRCDACRNGYWNFNNSNPDVCEKCPCNMLGVLNSQICDPSNGMCFCKRYVTGADCDQCLPGFYGLSDSENGCSPCDCDLGGALDVTCDVITGQCKCRTNVTGRRCDHGL